MKRFKGLSIIGFLLCTLLLFSCGSTVTLLNDIDDSQSNDDQVSDETAPVLSSMDVSFTINDSIIALDSITTANLVTENAEFFVSFNYTEENLSAIKVQYALNTELDPDTYTFSVSSGIITEVSTSNISFNCLDINGFTDALTSEAGNYYLWVWLKDDANQSSATLTTTFTITE